MEVLEQREEDDGGEAVEEGEDGGAGGVEDGGLESSRAWSASLPGCPSSSTPSPRSSSGRCWWPTWSGRSWATAGHEGADVVVSDAPAVHGHRCKELPEFLVQEDQVRHVRRE